MRWWRCAGLLVLLAAGCGLDEYEKKMREQQQVLEREKKLGQRLDLPDSKKRGVEVFCRPPREIPTSYQQKGDDWLYAYTVSKDSPIGVYLAWPREKEKQPEKEKHAEKAKEKQPEGQKEKQTEKPKEKQNLKEVVERGLKGKIVPESRAPSPPESVRGGNLSVEKSAILRGGDGQDKRWTGYLYLDNQERVAIVYVVPGEQANQQALEEIKASLGTLALGSEAREARREYDERVKSQPGKK